MNDVTGVPVGYKWRGKCYADPIQGNIRQTFFGPLSFKTKYDIWVTILPSGRSRWLDIGQVFFYVLMGLVHKHAKNPRPMSIHFDRTSLLNKRCSIICLLCISKKHEHLYGLILNVTCLSLPQA